MARYYDPILERWVSDDDQEAGALQSIDYGSGVYINPVTGNYYTQDDPVGVQMPVSQISAMSGEGVGGTAGIVAPGWMYPDATTGSLMPLDALLGASSPDPYNLYRDATLAPEQLSARNDFISAFPGYGQVGTPYFNDDGSYKAYGTPGGFLIDPNNVINDPTYGPITTLDNFGYAGGKGGHGDAVTALLAMAAAGYGSSLLGAEAGAAGATPSVATPSVATLPDSYWSMLADAGTGAVTDAGAVGAGTVGSDFSLAGATAGNPAGGLYSGASGLGLNPTSAGLGFTPSDALVAGMANGTSNALLTPAIAGAAGIPAAASTATNFLTGAQQAIPTAAESIGGAATAATTPATTAAGATPAAAGSAFSRLMDGTATASDWASVLGTVGATGLGLAGANAQANALKDVYNQQMTLGQPYRDRLNASYQPGFNLAQSDPAYQGALDTAAQAAARATSAQSGNPVGNPGAYAEMQKYITNSTALPYLQNYRSQLGTFGQLGTNTAGAAALGGAQSQGGTYNALGYGLGQLTQPDNPFKGLLSNFGKSGFSF